MREKKVSTLTVPAQHSYLSVVRTYVGEIARNMGFSEQDVDGIVLATSEAAANVVEHAFLPEEDASFELVCEASSLELKVIVRDRGLPFEPGQIERFSIDNILEGKKPAGLGFFSWRRA